MTIWNAKTGGRTELTVGLRVRYTQIPGYGNGTITAIGNYNGGDCIVNWDKSNARSEHSSNLSAIEVQS